MTALGPTSPPRQTFAGHTLLDLPHLLRHMSHPRNALDTWLLWTCMHRIRLTCLRQMAARPQACRQKAWCQFVSWCMHNWRGSPVCAAHIEACLGCAFGCPIYYALYCMHLASRTHVLYAVMTCCMPPCDVLRCMHLHSYLLQRSALKANLSPGTHKQTEKFVSITAPQPQPVLPLCLWPTVNGVSLPSIAGRAGVRGCA